MLNGQYCGNCAHWVDTRPTAKGHLPMYGKCAKGRPFKQGQMHKQRGYMVRYCDFTMRTDGQKCKDWSKEK